MARRVHFHKWGVMVEPSLMVVGLNYRQSFSDIGENSFVFHQLRDVNILNGKCGCCEFRTVCMGCHARAFATTANYLDEQPFCVYQPRAKGLQEKGITPAEVSR